ncbi:AAA domain-containing protein [Parasphaerochaeta coccoides]|uniref:DNA helicase n=1 Tax=Parasphaerochaeta coccoides (strain ATCC BAA-1237 / DSM 17374 / SPN1) TaxID=760011 RepID=F4GIT3_PARC1|nr:AAA domain-containing protein [Parasphaerochaeta coccoides]AEC02701.1 DNA helicase [Parasphaerochaeta coccoides DSM 17374]
MLDASRDMILKDGQDISKDIKSCTYHQQEKKFEVVFQNGKRYLYNQSSLRVLTNPKKLDPVMVQINHQGRRLFNVQALYVFSLFSEKYLRVIFSDGSERSYLWHEVQVMYSCLRNAQARDCMNYLRRLADTHELTTEDGSVLLKKYYDRISFIDEKSVLALYLNPAEHKPAVHETPDLIFPFGGNASQFEAVRNALTSQLSVIQGPPGTGKTQTILNIIANLLVQGKTIQVVSCNNSATVNVSEKLSAPKYGMDFLVASLGKAHNKTKFLENQLGKYPDLSEWKKSHEALGSLKKNIRTSVAEISHVFSQQRCLADVRQKLDSLDTEIVHFKRFCTETRRMETISKLRQGLSSDKLMNLWQECRRFDERSRPVSLCFKVKAVLACGIGIWKLLKRDLATVVTLLQGMFYQVKRTELAAEAASLVKALEEENAVAKMWNLTEWSLDYLHAQMYERYGGKSKREKFSSDDLWQRPNDFIQEYPVVLSTTFSSRSSLGVDVTYDYLIMDEASQVDIVTGALSLSSARNAVIVGDLKQLPNVVDEKTREHAEEVFKTHILPEGYSFVSNSLLKSICSLFPAVPQKMLHEHYRCHPKIIGFCNQKFYGGQLIIMTEDKGEDEVLSVYRTVVGNHERDHANRRQVDVICNEVLPCMMQSSQGGIGIITPYKNQVETFCEVLGSCDIDVATVHRFQGREKDTIILSTVDNGVSEFLDNPYLLNVAVSRAKMCFCLVVSGNELPADSNVSDLVSYIEYNNGTVVQSRIYSIFDYLYKQYTDSRMEYLKNHKNVSRYDSENLMYELLTGCLAKHPSLPFSVICHQPLYMLIRDVSSLNDEERKYVKNPATHVDFLIYNKVSRSPFLAIEVDGVHFHREGTRQSQRDKMKNSLFDRYGIRWHRFSTDGSQEMEWVENELSSYEKAQKETLSHRQLCDKAAKGNGYFKKLSSSLT